MKKLCLFIIIYSTIMSLPLLSTSNDDLIKAACDGNFDRVRKALQDGADFNAAIYAIDSVLANTAKNG